LFHIGIVRDATELAATCLAAAAVGKDVDHAFVHHERTWVRLADGRIEPFPSLPVEHRTQSMQAA
jgi:hypothetical protein